MLPRSLSQYTPRLRISGMGLAPFHSLGMMIQMVSTIYTLIPVSLFPPVVHSQTAQPQIPSSDLVLEHMRRTKSNALITIPSLLEELAQSEEGLEMLKSCDVVGYGAGYLSHQLGNSLASAGVKLQPLYGATESGAVGIVRKDFDATEWIWIEFSESTNIHWEPQGDGTFECQYLTCDTHHPAIENMQDPRGYASSDLFIQHPTKNLWKIVGRIDDVIIHSSGEKTVPTPVEAVLTTSPLINGAVMFGSGRNQAGILIEPAGELVSDINEGDLAKLRNKLWLVIEEANKDAPSFSRIYKEMILITSPDKPLPRSNKGTVKRKTVLQMYEAEIEDLYRAIESNTDSDEISPPESWDHQSLKNWLLEQAKNIRSGNDISSSRDLFEQGFDSLSATILLLRIVGAVRKHRNAPNAEKKLSQNIIYAYPNIDKLSAYIAELVDKPEGSTTTKSNAALIEAMIEKYSAGLGAPLSPSASECEGDKHPRIVLLTGTTGHLGADILALLLRDDSVERVYALNRPGSKSSLARHEDRFKDKGLGPKLLNSEKLVLLEGDASQSNLGLPPSIYCEIQNSVTLIIHVAWKVDFNLTLASFESNIQSTRNLIDTARSGPYTSSLRFIYTSSIASTQAWDHSNGPYPEEVVYDASTAVGGGYGESKYVAERVLAESGLRATSLRLGQLCGGTPNGCWSTSDWFPILLKSSLALGAIPVAAGVVSWVPIGAAAQAILEVATSADAPPVVLNVVHPKPISWKDMAELVRDEMAQLKGVDAASLRLIHFNEWMERLEKHSTDLDEDTFHRIPAIKLMPFFRRMVEAERDMDRRHQSESSNLPNLSTHEMQNISKTLANLQSLCREDAKAWINYWRNAVFV